MQNPPPVQTTKSSTGLDDNIAALLSYIFGWVSGLIFFVMEKDSRVAAAIVRGVSYSPPTAESGVQRMIRRPDLDLFR